MLTVGMIIIILLILYHQFLLTILTIILVALLTPPAIFLRRWALKDEKQEVEAWLKKEQAEREKRWRELLEREKQPLHLASHYAIRSVNIRRRFTLWHGHLMGDFLPLALQIESSRYGTHIQDSTSIHLQDLLAMSLV
jgi:hypothetical protein